MNGHNALVETFLFAEEFHFAFECIRQASSRALDVRVIYANIESFMKSVVFIYWFKIHDDWLKQSFIYFQLIRMKMPNVE